MWEVHGWCNILFGTFIVFTWVSMVGFGGGGGIVSDLFGTGCGTTCMVGSVKSSFSMSWSIVSSIVSNFSMSCKLKLGKFCLTSMMSGMSLLKVVLSWVLFSSLLLCVGLGTVADGGE